MVPATTSGRLSGEHVEGIWRRGRARREPRLDQHGRCPGRCGAVARARRARRARRPGCGRRAEPEAWTAAAPWWCESGSHVLRISRPGRVVGGLPGGVIAAAGAFEHEHLAAGAGVEQWPAAIEPPGDHAIPLRAQPIEARRAVACTARSWSGCRRLERARRGRARDGLDHPQRQCPDAYPWTARTAPDFGASKPRRLEARPVWQSSVVLRDYAVTVRDPKELSKG